MQPTIVHVGKYYPPHRGGIETHLRDLAAGMSSAGSVKVLVAGHSIRRRTEVRDGAIIVRVPTFGSFASMPITPTLALDLLRTKPGLVHVQTPNPAAAAAIVAAGYHGPLVITHQADVLGRPFLKRISRPFVDALMRRADRIIVTSHRYMDSSDELAPFRSKCVVIPLGITLEGFTAEEDAKAERVRMEYGSPIILAVGRLVGYKGLIYLVEAMKYIQAKLLLIGTGPLRDKLEASAIECCVSDKIRFLGSVDDVRPFYRASSIFVLPSISRAEAFGLVQLEALSAGVPVINTNVESGVPEVSVDGVTGITVPPRDPAALARAVNRLLADPPLRRKMGEAGRARVETLFSARLMVERIVNLYQEILTERARC